MIAKKYGYSRAEQIGDRYIVEIRVDKEMIEVMQRKILDDLKDAAVFFCSEGDNSVNEIEDGLNYMKNLIRSYEDLRDCLEEIDIKESLAKIPEDEDVQE